MIRQRVLPIVEGEGDERAVPVLLRRMLHEVHCRYDIQVLSAHRRGELPKVKASFERFFQAAALENAAILCVLDFDCDTCIDVLAEEAGLRQRAQALRSDVPFEACFIVKEFESLFLWDAASTRTALPLINKDCQFPSDPEAIRDAKGWLKDAQPKGHSYKPTIHQAKLASLVNLDTLLAHSASYRRLNQAVLKLVCNP